MIKFKHLLPWFVFVTLLVLWGYMHFGHSGTGNSPKADTVYKRDTLWKRYDTVIRKTLVVKEIIHDSIPRIYEAPKDYDSLKVKYNSLLKEFATRNLYQDSLLIDSFGYVLVQDTVQFNKLGMRSYSSHYQLPIVIDSVTIKQTAAPKHEIYYGGGVSGSFNGLDFAHTGILYKSKKSHITGLYLGVAPDGKISYGIHKYWKITLKK